MLMPFQLFETKDWSHTFIFLLIWTHALSHGFCSTQEQPRPEYEAIATDTRLNPITKIEEPFISVGRKVPRFVCSFGFILFMVRFIDFIA